MQVVEVNASFVGMMISCFAVVGCILVGIFYGHETRKKMDRLKYREDIKYKSALKMSEYEAKQAHAKGYESGFELGYQQAIADFKTGKLKIGGEGNSESSSSSQSNPQTRRNST